MKTQYLECVNMLNELTITLMKTQTEQTEHFIRINDRLNKIDSIVTNTNNTLDKIINKLTKKICKKK